MKHLIPLILACVSVERVACAQLDVRARVSEEHVLVSALNHSTFVTSDARVFSGRLDIDFVSNDPGFNSFSGDLPVGEAVEWDFMPMRHDGVTSTLFYWDGVGSEPAFGLSPAEVTLFGQNFASIDADGGDEIVVGPILFRADSEGPSNPGGGTHTHRDFLVHDGTFNQNTTPDEGFYLTSMRLRVDGFARSDPFFVVLGTDGSSTADQGQIVLPWVEDNADALVLRGDHNFDGVVDAADYTVWRDGLGATHTPADADDWIANYGAVADPPASALQVPEPAILGLFLQVGVLQSVFSRRLGHFVDRS